MGVKYDDVPCDSYTYHRRSRSMRRVVTAADLATTNGSRSLIPYREGVSRNRNERSDFSRVDTGTRTRTVRIRKRCRMDTA